MHNSRPPFTSLTLVILIYIVLSPFMCCAQGAGGAIQLDGINDYAEFNNNNRGITDQLTVEAWIKTGSMGHHHIVSKYDRDSENGFQLLVQNGKACLAGRDGSGNYRMSGYSTAIVTDNKWHHLAGVVHDGTWIIYVDGILQNQHITGYSNTVLNSNENLLLGNYYYEYLGNHFYQGQVDEVRIWKKALSAEEIRQNMCRTLSAASPDLIAYFKLDNIAGGVIADHSPLKLNGRLMNTNPATTAITSGAAIGDISTYRYLDNWNDESIVLVGSDGSRLEIDSAGSNTVGLHIYYINTRPNTTQGIQDRDDVKIYYGVFTSLSPASKHKISYIPVSSFCTAQLYERESNTNSIWSEITGKKEDDRITGISSGSRGEYVATIQTAGKLEIKGPTRVCEGGIMSLTVDTTAPVRWNNGETSKSITVSESGKYWVTAIENGCTLSDTVTLETVSFPTVDLGPDRLLCAGEAARLEAPAGYTYLWSTGATTSHIDVGRSGEYWVEVTNSGGCTAKDALTVTANPLPDIPPLEEIMACYGEQVLLDATTAGASYLWSNGQTTSSIEVTTPTDMSVAITIAGCTYTRTIWVSDVECPVIPNIITPNGDGKNDTFVAQGVEQNTMKLHIFNRWGKAVFQTDQYANNWTAPDMPAGMYYYQFTSNRTQKVYKGWVEVVK